jgi:hypothetical protein
MRLGGEINRSLGRILQNSREDLRALTNNRVGGAGTLAAKALSKRALRARSRPPVRSLLRPICAPSHS